VWHTLLSSGRKRFAAWIAGAAQESTRGQHNSDDLRHATCYLLRILVVRAIALLRRANENPGNYPWRHATLALRPFKVVAVALANKDGEHGLGTAGPMVAHIGAPELA